MKKHLNYSSIILSKAENEELFKILGPSCLTYCTTVAQLYLTMGPFHSNWVLNCTGVICLINDRKKRSYFFRIFSLEDSKMLWEHELYTCMEYKREKLFLHTFEGQDSLVAFNFAHVIEADNFFALVQRKIQNLNKIYSKKCNSKSKIATAKRGIEISHPCDFQHLQHAGFHPDRGFSAFLTGVEFQNFFAQAGVSPTQMRTKSTQRIIKSFIEDYGEAKVASALTEKQPPPPRMNSLKTVSEENAVTTQSKSSTTIPAPPPPTGIQTPQQNNPPPIATDGRANLLESIKIGKKLNPVSERKISQAEPNLAASLNEAKNVEVDIATAMKLALMSRNIAVASEDSSDEGDIDDEEWE